MKDWKTWLSIGFCLWLSSSFLFWGSNELMWLGISIIFLSLVGVIMIRDTKNVLITSLVLLLGGNILFYLFSFIAFFISKATANPNFGGYTLILTKTGILIIGVTLFVNGLLRTFTSTDRRKYGLIVFGILLVLLAWYAIPRGYWVHRWNTELLRGSIYPN